LDSGERLVGRFGGVKGKAALKADIAKNMNFMENMDRKA
jgi:hypothetical protein